jgi:hypothetical protein
MKPNVFVRFKLNYAKPPYFLSIAEHFLGVLAIEEQRMYLPYPQMS